MNTHELSSMGKVASTLDFGNHLGDTFHDFTTAQHLSAPGHDSATDLPSRAPSKTKSDMSATLSG